MFKHTLIATTLALVSANAMASSAPELTGVDAKYQKAKFTPKIIGGTGAAKSEIPWQVSLQSRDGSHFCGGSLIDKEWVLTAAHCVENSAPEQLQVRIGINDLNSKSGETRYISKVVAHAGYAQGQSTDIAVLKLDKPVTNIQPVALADKSVMDQSGIAGTNARVSGWGNTSTTGEDFPNQLMKVEVPLVSNQVCNSAQAYGGQVQNTELCAGLAQGGKDSCQGDSGGPLVIKHKGQWTQAGVVSWGDGCALPDKYGIYARVSSFTDWISKAKKGEITGAPTPAPTPTPSPTPGPTPDPKPTNAVLISQNVAGKAGETQVFKVDVPEGARMLWVDTVGGTGDVDIYIAHDRTPTTDNFDYAQAKDGNNEYEFISAPQSGSYYILLSGYSDYKDVSLNVLSR